MAGMDGRDEKIEIGAFLKRHWSSRCELVGDQSLDDLVNAVCGGQSTDNVFKPIQGGADFDFGQSLQVLTQAVILVKACIEIYKTWDEVSLKKAEKPSPDRLAEEVKATGAFKQVTDPTVAGKLKLVIEDVVSH